LHEIMIKHHYYLCALDIDNNLDYGVHKAGKS
jgi:hypothetical protein